MNRVVTETVWYAARVKYRTEQKIKAQLEVAGIKHFIPMKTVETERNGKKTHREKPLIPCLMFVYADRQTALELPLTTGFTINYIRNTDTKQLQIIPDKQMQDFMRVVDLSEAESLEILTANLKRGDKVRVVRGIFAGIEGELVRVKGHKRVVVRLDGLVSLATTYIPTDFLELI
ncbi:MAG: UpxY family transcription antiterminator [Candidatus Symbiothrix sp.]|jgi:transcription antitermination factor NusG|nr:UpxY family transcription antiterminator [Candidatus Symbiothrix sp.]